MKSFLILLGALIASGLLTRYALLRQAAGLCERGRREKPHPCETAIVLGAYTDGYQPSPTLLARLHVALQLYRAEYIRTIIVSGGRGEDETVSEARSMKRFFILNGVPPEVILEERTSSDTWENLNHSKVLMTELGIKSAIVVTSDYHLPRALSVARRIDMDVTGCAAVSHAAERKYAVREVLANIQYTVKGRVSNEK